MIEMNRRFFFQLTFFVFLASLLIGSRLLCNVSKTPGPFTRAGFLIQSTSLLLLTSSFRSFLLATFDEMVSAAAAFVLPLLLLFNLYAAIPCGSTESVAYSAVNSYWMSGVPGNDVAFSASLILRVPTQTIRSQHASYCPLSICLSLSSSLASLFMVPFFSPVHTKYACVLIHTCTKNERRVNKFSIPKRSYL